MIGRIGAARAWVMIIILSMLFVMSTVDRFVLGLLVEPLKQDLGISDVQLGLLFGSAFAIFYGAVTIPMARIADRGHRVRLIVFGVVLWCTCTVLSSMATSFIMLLILRIGLAVGESALVPAGYSIIGDALPPHRRTLGATVFNVFGMAGAAGAYIITSAAISLTYELHSDGFLTGFRVWQAVFILVGLPGLVLAGLLALIGREPARSSAAGEKDAASLIDVLRFARAQGWLYPGLFLGAGCVQLATNAFLAWGPTYLSRAFGLSIVEAGRIYGIYNVGAFVSGSLAVPAFGAWLGRRRHDAVVIIGVTCAVLAGIFCVAAVFQSNPFSFLVCVFVGLFFAMGGAGNMLTMLHFFTPSRMRATLVALSLICLTTIALGVAPPLVGAISTNFATGDAALGLGLGVVAALGTTLSLLFFLAARVRVMTYPVDHAEGVLRVPKETAADRT